MRAITAGAAHVDRAFWRCHAKHARAQCTRAAGDPGRIAHAWDGQRQEALDLLMRRQAFHDVGERRVDLGGAEVASFELGVELSKAHRAPTAARKLPTMA